jgi:hypothetical protein
MAFSSGSSVVTAAFLKKNGKKDDETSSKYAALQLRSTHAVPSLVGANGTLRRPMKAPFISAMLPVPP